MSRFLVPALLLVSACASAPRGVPLPMASPPPTSVDLASAYRPGGAIFVGMARSAGVTNTYGAYRVVGPSTSLSRTPEGRWGGTLGGQTVLLEIQDGRIIGAGVDLAVRKDGESLVVSGLWRTARLDLDFRATRIGGTPGGGCSLDLRLTEGSTWRGFLACPNPDAITVRLEGEAVEVPDPAMPQWLFAFLGALSEGQ